MVKNCYAGKQEIPLLLLKKRSIFPNDSIFLPQHPRQLVANKLKLYVIYIDLAKAKDKVPIIKFIIYLKQ